MRLRFVLGQVAKGMRHNLAMTISVILVTCVSLLFVGTGVLTQMQVGKIQDQWYSRVEVSVYMCVEGDPTPACDSQSATSEQVTAVEERLKSPELREFVKSVTHVSSADAYAQFREQIGDTTLGQLTTEDMLPESFRVAMKNPKDYDVISSEVSGMPGVQSVQDQRQVVEPLLRTLNRATVMAWGLAGVMMIAALLLITTTIRLSALSRKRETTVMRYVGASNLFIQLPFMIEGALAALVGAGLAVAGLWAGLHFVVGGWIAPAMPYINVVGASDLLIVGPVLVAAAILVALVASMVSLAKYTKA
ncbi:ABC transporter permease [Nanchangia anserum]|uniref:Cell division protein FtsX n=1 Tax=Nanchangia anserum TaxID=2692125 RepID=A0A8I0GCC7_9ACTO|nr:permease-like cell division protein FtsX [Nanchangia anserum]MBD3690163.1 ABC transporter permease [Nanchangia anserum]QOX82381.1 ABC transporter permease [Nanchangia anserum]